MKKVIVSAGPDGSPIVVSKDSPAYGSVRVEQERHVISETGWLKIKSVSALILGSVEELKRAGYEAGQELEGKIVIRESLSSFNPKNPEKDLKIAGNTEITCMVGDKPIYRKAFYSQNPDAQDVLVAHTNSEVIKAKHASMQKETADLNK